MALLEMRLPFEGTEATKACPACAHHPRLILELLGEYY
jgi:hypothetical protein